MIRRGKRIFSLISIILCVSIGLTLPAEVFAATLPKEEKIYSSFDNVQGETESVGNIVSEPTDEKTLKTLYGNLFRGDLVPNNVYKQLIKIRSQDI